MQATPTVTVRPMHDIISNLRPTQLISAALSMINIGSLVAGFVWVHKHHVECKVSGV